MHNLVKFHSLTGHQKYYTKSYYSLVAGRVLDGRSTPPAQSKRGRIPRTSRLGRASRRSHSHRSCLADSCRHSSALFFYYCYSSAAQMKPWSAACFIRQKRSRIMRILAVFCRFCRLEQNQSTSRILCRPRADFNFIHVCSRIYYHTHT